MITTLLPAQLKRYCDTASLGFNDTDEIEENIGLIGQKRAERALEFGLKLRASGYNIYISGHPGTGRTTFARVFAKKMADTMTVPEDYCYVYNFAEPKYPRLLRLPPGRAKEFRADMEDFLAELSQELPKALGGKEFEQNKLEIVKLYKRNCDELIKKITEEAKQQSFGVKMSANGMYFMPIVDDEMLTEEQFDALPDEDKEAISKNSDKVHEKAAVIMSRIKEQEKATRADVAQLEFRTSLLVVGRLMTGLYNRYSAFCDVLDYLNLMKEDILENLESIINDETNEEESLQNLMPWLQKRGDEDALSKYRVNVLTDNSGLNGAPVIVEYNPTYTNLVGEVEYDSEYGNFTTDYMKIKPGTLHKANGGFLILQAQDVLSNPHVWETIKRFIKTGMISMEPFREHLTGVTVAGIKPQPSPLDVKIIMVGSSYYYELLAAFDDEFLKLFKINAVFDYEMKLDKQAEKAVAGFVKHFSQKRNTPAFSADAIARLLEHMSRMADDQKKLSTSFGVITDILTEAAAWAKTEKATLITAAHIETALLERDYRRSMYEEKLSELIEENSIMIATEGKVVGQINGLAVLDSGDYIFAKPSRITATTYIGKSGIVNIEKEAKLSGEIHDKGMGILAGYLGQTYAQEFPLSLSCRVCFEQNYSGIDGDSASSTEAYAILSSLSGLPINQEFAVTGSMNQRGEIQPIGGVTYKIEGFFDLCEKRGLTGNQGVIIPRTNIKELSLKQSVIDAVAAGKFHIYAIDNIDDGIELLTGVRAGNPNDTDDCVHGLVAKKLRDYYRKSMPER